MSHPILEFLDIRPEDENFYRVLLRTGGASPQQLARHCDMDEEAVCVLQKRAIGLGLATVTDGLLRPITPAKAVQNLIDHRIALTREELESAAAAHGVVAALLAERDTAAPADPFADSDRPMMKHLEGLAEVRAAIDELAFYTRSESLTTWPGGRIPVDSITTARPLDERILRRGIRMRSLFGAAALDDAETMAYLRELVRKGAEVRISRVPLERILIYDRAAALTPIDPADSIRGALLTREPGLVAALVSLFERMWGQAQELPVLVGEDGPESAGERPSEIERRILESLTTADKDETGARDIGISVRTYRKYVAALMQRLDASNRFHAALLARERGWI
ncbi:helix-turn-helix transcriptional regulator [Streptomyces sp. AK02-01A]|uniref:helix-turn-helix transcriptional regulator n=1 Tax=Streptomyces sp. AK02-01A TaxID=3028648 RepID=UPI0029B4D2DE|nr:helix-turn-helix transcriptional regulator [Streptomyces sp. AK02-01A]MDX3854073.1 helix-turn-helix transcriptional regulator [Streptomyces sp. AK02-01A]